MLFAELMHVSGRFGQVIPGSIQPHEALIRVPRDSRRIGRHSDTAFRDFPKVPFTWGLQRGIPVHQHRPSGVGFHQVRTVWFTMRDHPLRASVQNILHERVVPGEQASSRRLRRDQFAACGFGIRSGWPWSVKVRQGILQRRPPRNGEVFSG